MDLMYQAIRSLFPVRPAAPCRSDRQLPAGSTGSLLPIRLEAPFQFDWKPPSNSIGSSLPIEPNKCRLNAGTGLCLVAPTVEAQARANNEIVNQVHGYTVHGYTVHQPITRLSPINRQAAGLNINNPHEAKRLGHFPTAPTPPLGAGVFIRNGLNIGALPIKYR